MVRWGGSRLGLASRYAIGSPARLSSELDRAAFQAMTLRKLMYHRLAVAGTATRAFLPADVPSAAKPGFFMGRENRRSVPLLRQKQCRA